MLVYTHIWKMLANRFFCVYRSTAMFITIWYVCITSFHHPVQIKVMMHLWHWTDYLFIPGHPGKSLFTCHCVKRGVSLLDIVRIVLEFAGIIYMILYVKRINYFCDVLPNELQVSYKNKYNTKVCSSRTMYV